MKVKSITLGSLFDGIGGFPFCAELSGITPVWAAEIEPACVAVTMRHFPDMLHYGDVSKINGAEIPPVDIITFGSPCQDLSVAGKRKGLKHTDNGDDETTRSGLFIEAIRIIYEMREATYGKYPAFIVWENVPGAFSSHKGHDFQTVLEEITKADIPMPASGKWANAGVVRGRGICAAWRLLDAQYWGVPQRRKRIYLVGSFGSRSAEEILFKPDRVQRYLTPCRTARQGTAANTQNSAGIGDFEKYGMIQQDTLAFDKAQITSKVNGSNPQWNAPCHTLSMGNAERATVIMHSSGFCDKASAKVRGIGYEVEKSATLRVGQTPSVVYAQCIRERCGCEGGGKGCLIQEEKTGAISTNNDQFLCYAIQGSMVGREEKNGPQGNGINENICFTLNTTDRHAAVYAIDRVAFNQGENAKYNSGIYEAEQTRTIDRNGGNPSCNQGGTVICQKSVEWIVRRLTPTECERLQGYPDGWTRIPKIKSMSEADYELFKTAYMLDKQIRGKKVKTVPTREQLLKWYNKLECDGTRYKQLGNSLAIPCALRVISGIAEYIRGKKNDRIQTRARSYRHGGHRTGVPFALDGI